MTNVIRNKYSAKDIEKLLGIGSDKLLYWVRKGLIVPDEVGRGRGTVNYFSIEKLFYLALIQKLERYRIELNSIKDLIEAENIIRYLEELGVGVWDEKAEKHRKKIEDTWKRDFLKVYRAHRNDYKEKDILLLGIYWNQTKGHFEKFFGPSVLILKRIKRAFYGEFKDTDFGEIILIDISKIIHDLEIATGETI